MATEKKQSFLGGAAVLAFGIVAVKIIGAVFKIPLRNILGEGGSADFSNAYNIYATLLTVSTAGLPVALSKLVSESYALGRTRQAHRTFRVSLSVFLVLGVASFALMWWGSDLLAGFLNNPRAAYGIYSACMDLYNLPSSLMVALTASVIPAVSAAVTQRDRRQSARIVRSSLRVTALLAFPMGLGLWALSDPLFRLFYRSYNAELGGSLLAVLGIASIFVCLMLITNSILQAYGRVSVPIVTMLVGGGVKIVLNYNLVALPSVNIHPPPIGTLVCFALTALLNLIAVARIAPFRLNYPGYFLRPLFASLVMAFAARGVYALAAHFLIPSVEEAGRLTLLLCVGLAIGIAVVIYGVLVLALHCIRRSDLELLPKGDKLARLLHIS